MSDVPDVPNAPMARYDQVVDNAPLQALLQRDFSPFWKRLVAALLDGLFVQLIGAVLGGIVAVFALEEIPILEVAYAIGFIAVGATPGMRLLGIRVIDAAGNPPGVKRSIVRYLIPAASFLPWFFVFASPDFMFDFGVPAVFVLGVALAVLSVLDALWMIWDADKQMLHDKLASTYVINTR